MADTTNIDLTAEFDSRLADLWLSVFVADEDEDLSQMAWFLRMAYLQGYRDALTEPVRGQLFKTLGVPTPAREKLTRRGVKR